MSMDLSSLARTLAEPLVKVRDTIGEKIPGYRIICFDRTLLTLCIRREDAEVHAENLTDRIEAVIREAIDKTIDEAERLAELRGECAEIGGLLHNLNEQYKRGVIDSARQIQDAIRSLKQSNSGRAEQGIVREK